MTRARWEPEQHQGRGRGGHGQGRHGGQGHGGQGHGGHGDGVGRGGRENGRKDFSDGWTEEWRRASEGDKIDRFKGICLHEQRRIIKRFPRFPRCMLIENYL